jgi:hypothetical protein
LNNLLDSQEDAPGVPRDCQHMGFSALELRLASESMYQLTENMMEAAMEQKPWYESKINWVQILGSMAMFGTLFGWTVSPDMVTTVAGAVAGVQAATTMVMRTWFSK